MSSIAIRGWGGGVGKNQVSEERKGIGEGSRVALEASNTFFLSLYKIYKPKYKSLTLNEHECFTKNKINKNYA